MKAYYTVGFLSISPLLATPDIFNKIRLSDHLRQHLWLEKMPKTEKGQPPPPSPPPTTHTFCLGHGWVKGKTPVY